MSDTVSEELLVKARRAVANEAACNSVGWRKLLLRRWADLSCITQSFHQLWNEHFPHHDALTSPAQAARAQQGRIVLGR